MNTIIIWFASSILILLICIFIFQLHARIKGAPLVRSKESTLKKSGELLALQKGEIFYDLGCGDGVSLFYFEQHYMTKGIGVEQSILLVLWNRWKAFWKKSSITFIRKDLTKWTPSVPGKYYLFMMPKLFPKLEHIFSAMPSGTRILCNTFPLIRDDMKLITKVEDDGFQKGEWLFLFEKI